MDRANGGHSKKLLNSDINFFICSVAVTSKQHVRVFKSGSKGTSSVDLQGLINKALDIDVTVYSNSDVALSATSLFEIPESRRTCSRVD